MKILMYEWKIFGKQDIIDSFEKLGHTVRCITTDRIMDRENVSFDQSFQEEIRKESYDFVFTINYSPILSNNCEREGLKYISIIYDSPLVSLYSYTIIHKCNYVFLFDSALYQELRDGGINTVYYMPLAVNMDRLDAMEQTEAIKKIFSCDVSFLGSMYTEKYTFFDRLKNLSEYTRGYLDSIMNAQLKVYGDFFVQDLLNGEVLKELKEKMPYTPNKDGIETPEYIYANYFIGRKLAEMERKNLLGTVSEQFQTRVYTHNPTPQLPKVENMGSIDYYLNMPYAFRYSKINLNITLRTIRTGIPLRAMDIMGAGGFLMTNYQADLMRHFVPGEDFVYFESEQDLLDKCRYYLKHEEERARIALSGQEKIRQFHNYPLRLQQIIEICMGNVSDES